MSAPSEMAEVLQEALEALRQIPLDFKYPPAADSIERRIERADAVAEKIVALIDQMEPAS